MLCSLCAWGARIASSMNPDLRRDDTRIPERVHFGCLQLWRDAIGSFPPSLPLGGRGYSGTRPTHGVTPAQAGAHPEMLRRPQGV